MGLVDSCKHRKNARQNIGSIFLNEALLKYILQDPLRVQPHLRKCFEGIKTVDFAYDLTIHGMNSAEGEKVPYITSCYSLAPLRRNLCDFHSLLPMETKKSENRVRIINHLDSIVQLKGTRGL